MRDDFGPAAVCVVLDGELAGFWDPERGALDLGAFEFESRVLSGGVDAQLTWPAWAPSAALASLWAGGSPAELGRTSSADAGSLVPRRVGPTVPERFAGAGWSSWIAPGSDDLALWPPAWLGFEDGLEPGALPLESWSDALAEARAAHPDGLLAALVLPLSDLAIGDGDRAGAWRAWSSANPASTVAFEADEVDGLARGEGDLWRSVGQRTARRRGRPEALAFEALEQGARLLAADRWLAAFEARHASASTALWVTCAGTVDEDQGAPRVPLFASGPGASAGRLPSELSPADVPGLGGRLAAAVGLRLAEPDSTATAGESVEAAFLWGADPNRPYRWGASGWESLPDPWIERESGDALPLALSAGWLLRWPADVPPGELRVKLNAAEADALQGWLIGGRDGSLVGGRANAAGRAEWRFPGESAPAWLAIALDRRGVPVRLEVSLDGQAIPEEQFFFQGEPLGRAPLPRLADPRAEPAEDFDGGSFVALTSQASGAALQLTGADRLVGARRWPPGPLSWEQPIDPTAALFLDWRSPGRPALAIDSGEAYRPSSELLFDQCMDRGERTAWVLWPVEPGPSIRSRDEPESTATKHSGGSSGGDLNFLDPRRMPAAPAPEQWDLRPLGAPFASDPGLWSRPVTPALWELRQRQLRRAPNR